jgi:hypothetical protein
MEASGEKGDPEEHGAEQRAERNEHPPSVAPLHALERGHPVRHRLDAGHGRASARIGVKDHEQAERSCGLRAWRRADR